MVLRRVAVDNVRRRRRYGRDYARWRDVPAMAAHYASRGVVPQYGCIGTHWSLFRYRNFTSNILHHHGHCGVTRNMDIPQSLCRCRIRECHLSLIICSPNWTRPTSSLLAGGLVHTIMGMGYPQEEGQEEAGRKSREIRQRKGQSCRVEWGVCQPCHARGCGLIEFSRAESVSAHRGGPRRPVVTCLLCEDHC